MIIWGWGHQKTKVYGQLHETEICVNCNNEMNRVLLRDRTYFTLFFIPLIPYKTAYFSVCPICKDAITLSAQEFNYMLGGG